MDEVADPIALRQCVLAVAVLHDVDLVPAEDGVRVASGRLVRWQAIGAALRGADPASPPAVARLTTWLVALASLAWRSPTDLAARARPVGFACEDPGHPGPGWVRARVLGGALDLGVGLLGVGSDPEQVVVPPAGVLDTCGVDDAAWWPACADYLERMGALAGDRYSRRPEDALRPMGDADVVTLLGAAALRVSLAGRGVRTAGVPTRRRGWLDVSRTDPAFLACAAALAEPDDRGFPRPLLVTAEEVVLARAGGNPAASVLIDIAAPDPRPQRPPYLSV